ncbi:MAG: amidohydrolase [Bacteroidetes bacterium]|nr:amidohydrolase [Bacteroidota bacterium]
MKKLLFFAVICSLFVACRAPKQPADLIVHHAMIYSVDSAFTVYQAMAIKDGKIIALNTNDSIMQCFSSEQIIDAGGKAVFPGFIDAHCHFLGYAMGLQQCDLVGTKSFQDVLSKLVTYSQTCKTEWIVGRGWDQNDWTDKTFPNRKKLDSLFPDRPVFLVRIDGHAALANREALLRAGIHSATKVDGGVIEYTFEKDSTWTLPEYRKDIAHLHYPYWSPTGILIDNAVDMVKQVIPDATAGTTESALLQAQKNCFEMGLTTVDEAGIHKQDVELMDKLQKDGKLKMRIYAMLSDDSANYTYLNTGPYKTDRMNVRSFKFYADGALGSRGACLLQDYSDKPGWRGFLLSNPEHFMKYAKLLYDRGFQMNTHCIGDSAVRLLQWIYNHPGNISLSKNGMVIATPNTAQTPVKERRWRIEHYQVCNTADLKNNHGIIPSIQPTHATSDMYWAEERLGKDRIREAYAYKKLLDAAGMVALGTDFPVEDISPFKTFYAAAVRKDSKGFPAGGFQKENALSRRETIRGMTIWAAYANFEESEKGSLEKGKFADFIILDTDLMTCDENAILNTKVVGTFINGEQVYKR